MSDEYHDGEYFEGRQQVACLCHHHKQAVAHGPINESYDDYVRRYNENHANEEYKTPLARGPWAHYNFLGR